MFTSKRVNKRAQRARRNRTLRNRVAPMVAMASIIGGVAVPAIGIAVTGVQYALAYGGVGLAVMCAGLFIASALGNAGITY